MSCYLHIRADILSVTRWRPKKHHKVPLDLLQLAYYYEGAHLCALASI